MASIINASTSGAGGLVSTADSSGVLNLQSGGTTVLGVNYTGGAARIQADWSQSTFTSRSAIQTSTLNSGSIVNFIPNGTGTGSVIDMYDKDSFVNSTRFRFGINASECYISQNTQGTGSFLPFNIYTGGSLQASLSTGGVFSFNSGYGSAAVAYGCRAWVNFNGTGTVAIRASGNVSSITDNGTGNYTINFTTAMVDNNYSTVATGRRTDGGAGGGGDINILSAVLGSAALTYNSAVTTSSVRVGTGTVSGLGFADCDCFVAIFR